MIIVIDITGQEHRFGTEAKLQQEHGAQVVVNVVTALDQILASFVNPAAVRVLPDPEEGN